MQIIEGQLLYCIHDKETSKEYMIKTTVWIKELFINTLSS